MNSVVLYTEEIDDTELAAEELLSQASEFEFRENSLGILFMDAEAEYEELYGLCMQHVQFFFFSLCQHVALCGYCALPPDML